MRLVDLFEERGCMTQAPISICLDGYRSDFGNTDRAVQQKAEKSKPITPDSTPPVAEQPVADSHTQKDEHQKYIEKLAQPKKPCPGGPARLQQKKKTIAFGRTVNVSQCIEGVAVKGEEKRPNTKKVTAMDQKNAEDEKENDEKVLVRGSTNIVNPRAKPSPKVTDSNGISTEDILKQLVENLVEQKLGDLMQLKQGSITTLARSSTAPTEKFMERLLKNHDCSEMERQLLHDLHAALRKNPDFAKPVTEIVRHHVIPNNDKITHNDRTNQHFERKERKEPIYNNQNSRAREYNRNSTVMERITLERSYQQPEYPYSVDTATFLANRKNIHPNKEHSSPEIRNSFSRPIIQEEPRSQYRPGNSVAFAPTMSYEEDYIDNDFDRFSEPSDHSFIEEEPPSHYPPSNLSPHELSMRQKQRKARLQKK